MATQRKIVKVSTSNYETACEIAENEGRCIADSIPLVALRRFQAEQSKNSPEKPVSAKKSVRLPSGRVIELAQRK